MRAARVCTGCLRTGGDVLAVERQRRLWGEIAYAARYGKQPLPVLMALSYRELCAFNLALSDLVKSESGK